MTDDSKLEWDFAERFQPLGLGSAIDFRNFEIKLRTAMQTAEELWKGNATELRDR